jgi:Lhr-like helicase
METFSIDPETLVNAIVGDIILVEGKKYRVTKKTRTAVAVERYFWFDALVDKLRGEK